MRDWLKENWFKVSLLTILTIFVIGAFYWFQWRPMQIRGKCMDVAHQGIDLYNQQKSGFDVNKFAAEQGYLSGEKIDELYFNCIRANGLKN